MTLLRQETHGGGSQTFDVATDESVVRDGDVCRWGGEEFAILLRNADEETAFAVAERIRTGVATLGVTASLGVATRTDDSDPRLLVEAADRALYSAKRAGRNRVWSGAALQTDVTSSRTSR